MAVLGFAAGLLISSITASVAEAATGYRPSSGGPLPVAVTVANLVGLWAGLVGAALWWSRTRGGASLAEDFGYRVAAWWDIPAGAALGLAAQYALVGLYKPFEHLDHNLTRQLGQPTQRTVGAAHTTVTAAVLLLFLAVGAPLVEELFFRGLLLRSLARWTNPVVAVVGSGVLFGLAHFEALQFAGLALFGVLLGALAWRLGRLGPSVAAHMSFNAVAVLTTVHLH
ncbi:MAG TPA: CPBP family intramembrane glutamic endopeptidase [Acidimicrobiales bacterium]|nr:CPBP family intramembrane glutamic endopeptidase [Acidimicrobiales bacterium]